MPERLEAEDPTFEVLFTPEDIRDRVEELAWEITQDYAEDPDTPLLIAGVLKGATPFLVDLSRSIKHPNLLIDYVGVSSYGAQTTSSKEPIITTDLRIPVEGKNVLIVEDIVNTGYSIATLINILSDRNPKSLSVCAFLSKPSRREVEVSIRYLGYEIDDKWVQGYGLDTNEKGRNWPYIAYKK